MRFENSYAYEPGSNNIMNGPIPGVHTPFDSGLKQLTPVSKSEAFELIDNNVSLSRQISTQINNLGNKLSIVLVNNVSIPRVDSERVSPGGKTDLENKLIECNMVLHSVLLELEQLTERVSL